MTHRHSPGSWVGGVSEIFRLFGANARNHNIMAKCLCEGKCAKSRPFRGKPAKPLKSSLRSSSRRSTSRVAASSPAENRFGLPAVARWQPLLPQHRSPALLSFHPSRCSTTRTPTTKTMLQQQRNRRSKKDSAKIIQNDPKTLRNDLKISEKGSE